MFKLLDLVPKRDGILRLFSSKPSELCNIPKKVDVLIIGAGAMGSSTAFWLKLKAGNSLSVLVIDRDLTYKTASTVLSVGGIRQQFSLKENIQLSCFGAYFIKHIREYLGESTDVQFHPNGYLSLASEKGEEILRSNHETQKIFGGVNTLLSPIELNKKFPWLNTEGISLGCLGQQNEGWFDPWILLTALKNQAQQLGAKFLETIPCEFKSRETSNCSSSGQHMLNNVLIQSSDGKKVEIEFKTCIVAAGADTGRLAKDLLNLDKCNAGLFQYEIPVERRKRYVYCLECPNNEIPVGSPMVIDPTGLYVRREGKSKNYICGCSPTEDEEPLTDNLDIDYNYFEEKLWPILANRIPSFEALKVRSAWAGFYDYNYFDKNGIVDYHPAYKNLIIVAGFSGHGIQLSPGIGRAVSELLLDEKFSTIDLSKFSFNRIILNEPVEELEII